MLFDNQEVCRRFYKVVLISLPLSLLLFSFLFFPPLRQESHFLQQSQCLQTGVVFAPDHGTVLARPSLAAWCRTYTLQLLLKYARSCFLCWFFIYIYFSERTSRECLSHRMMTSSGNCLALCGRRWACPCLASMSSSTTKRANMPSSTSTHFLVGGGFGWWLILILIDSF